MRAEDEGEAARAGADDEGKAVGAEDDVEAACTGAEDMRAGAEDERVARIGERG
jgi:hypothetical protein